MTMTTECLILLTRIALNCSTDADGTLRRNFSTLSLGPDDNLWLGSDEGNTVERLTRTDFGAYGDHLPFAVGDYVTLPDPEDEIDIEGMQCEGPYLWLVGSHSLKRKKPQLKAKNGKKGEKNQSKTADNGKKTAQRLEQFATLKADPNRYLLARIPLIDGRLEKTAAHPAHPAEPLQAAWLPFQDGGNALTAALADDPHVGPVLRAGLPGKENGFDIEGLAVRDERVWLGCRGPVLRGWSLVLDLEIEDGKRETLALKRCGPDGRRYRKQFFNLNGLGIRDLALQGDDLLILAGPTMALTGLAQLFRLRNVSELRQDNLIDQQPGGLELLGTIPLLDDTEKPEGLILFPWAGRTDTVLVVYDGPAAPRVYGKGSVLADVFAGCPPTA